MTVMMDMIKRIIRRMTMSNPFGLVMKGGTALAYHHLDWHRESEDLDFDAPMECREKIEEINEWIGGILSDMVENGDLDDFNIKKAGFARSERYHMKVLLTSYKEFQTKIDIDFRQIGSELEYEGELAFYSAEYMLVSKLNTYQNRGTLKDIYDISHLLKIIDPNKYTHRIELAELVKGVIERLDEEDLKKNYTKTFANIDMRFKNLKQKDIPTFKEGTLKELRIFRNKLVKEQ